MLDIYLKELANGGNLIRICDYGMTLMRLSYSYDIDTPNKEKIFKRILLENGVCFDQGNIYIDAKPEEIYPRVMQFSQVVAKISNMSYFKREVIKSLFYELLDEFVEESLQKYNPQRGILPIAERDELEVDYKLEVGKKPFYMFGVKDRDKARIVTISCLEFIRGGLPFRSIAVLEDSDNLGRKDRDRLTNAIDKQFPTLDDFRESGIPYLKREAA
jgi:hypothetical protein